MSSRARMGRTLLGRYARGFRPTGDGARGAFKRRSCGAAPGRAWRTLHGAFAALLGNHEDRHHQSRLLDALWCWIRHIQVDPRRGRAPNRNEQSFCALGENRREPHTNTQRQQPSVLDDQLATAFVALYLTVLTHTLPLRVVDNTGGYICSVFGNSGSMASYIWSYLSKPEAAKFPPPPKNPLAYTPLNLGSPQGQVSKKAESSSNEPLPSSSEQSMWGLRFRFLCYAFYASSS